jgi:hypothetical protein
MMMAIPSVHGVGDTKNKVGPIDRNRSILLLLLPLNQSEVYVSISDQYL